MAELKHHAVRERQLIINRWALPDTSTKGTTLPEEKFENFEADTLLHLPAQSRAMWLVDQRAIGRHLGNGIRPVMVAHR